MNATSKIGTAAEDHLRLRSQISFCQSGDEETKGRQHQRVVTVVLLWKYYSAIK